MIPHAAVTLPGAVGALLVTVIGAPLVAGPVLPARLAGRLRAAPGAADLAAVDMAVVAPAVNPEFVTAVLARS